MLVLTPSCSIEPPYTSSTIHPTTITKETTSPVEVSTSLIPSSTPTSLPSITPLPALSPEGPYLAFVTNRNGPLILMDIDGGGREMINLPTGAKIFNVKASISPSGEWIALYTGNLDPPYDLTLILLNLTDGSLQHVASLLADGYPDNLIPIAEQIAESHPNPAVRAVEHWISPVRLSFEDGIHTLDWSPDGLLLAFSAQIDGPSSDLYVYDINEKTILRITDDMQNIRNIEWTPDGDMILYQNYIVEQVYSLSSLHVAKPDGSQVWDLDPADTLWYGIKGWAGPYQLIVGHYGGDAHPPIALYYLDIRTNQIIPLWSDIYYDFAIDPDNQVLAVSGVLNSFDKSKGDLQHGIFLVYPNQEIVMVSQTEEPIWLTYLDNPTSRFIGCSSDGAFLLKKDGSTDFLTNKVCSRLYTSPDNKWIVVIHENEPALLFTNGGEFTGELQAYNVIWRPDSLGLFADSVDNLIHISVPDGQASIVYTCITEEFPCYFIHHNYSWIP